MVAEMRSRPLLFPLNPTNLCRMSLTQEALKAVLRYDPESGRWWWRVSTSNRVRAGQEAVGRMVNGYLHVGLFGRKYYAHRLAWFYMTGEWPPNQIDHINMDRADNRWSNLRLATTAQNKANDGRRSTNTSGAKGVSFDKSRGLFVAQICVNYKHHYLGRYATLEKAAEAYEKAAKHHFGEFARTG